MDISHRIGDSRTRLEMILNGIVTQRSERAIIGVSSQLNANAYYRLSCGQGWKPHELTRFNRNSSVGIIDYHYKYTVNSQAISICR
eukprot:6203822-Pleurochrysis_carterae.AAC.3